MFSLFNLREKYGFYIKVILGALAVSIAFFWLRDILAGEEGRVRKFILQGKRSMERKDIIACARMISPSYRDRYGNDRSTLTYVTKEFFNYYKDIFINIEQMKINFNGTKTEATVEIVALMVGSTYDNNMERILEGEKGRGRIKLIKEENKWKLAELDFYEPITIMGENVI